MKLKIKAAGICPLHYEISNNTINGIDFTPFVEGSKFIGNEQTHEAGVYDAEYVNGELQVTIGQRGIAYECDPINSSHDWRGGVVVNADEFDNDVCYINAVSKPEDAEYKRTDSGWTVFRPETEVEEEVTDNE